MNLFSPCYILGIEPQSQLFCYKQFPSSWFQPPKRLRMLGKGIRVPDSKSCAVVTARHVAGRLFWLLAALCSFSG